MIEQARYQVRLDWGIPGLVAIGEDAEIVVWVDTVREPDSLPELSVFPERAAVIQVDLRTAVAAARWISTLQERVARRLTIAIVAAGSPRAEGSIRFAVEDHLAAGAIVDALAGLGIDATSPEAAIAENAYRGLARAAAHLISASVGAAVQPAAMRIDSDLGLDDVLVIRPHPEG